MPNNMTINYLLDSVQSLLGTEIYQNITEIMLPSPHETGHKITLTRFFEGHTSHRWLIERIVHQTPEQTNLFLTPRIECENEIFLAKTYHSKRTVASRITKGTLVEVEYGFIQSTKRITGKISSVKRYPDFVQNGEMHKRRLAIVINACFPSTLQVIPITSIHQNNQVAYEQSSIRCHALEEKMIDWYCSMDGNLSQEDARKKLEQELTLYLEIYGS